jgi:hypothetical protein
MALFAALLGALAVARESHAQSATCADSRYVAASAANARSVTTLAFSPFGRAERGWETYAPLIQKEIGAACPASSSGFAAALARWQGRHGLKATGVMDAATFAAIKNAIQLRRPFVLQSRRACPAAPPAAALATGTAREGYGGKPLVLRPQALAAYRRMVAAARAESAAIRADTRLLTAFSSFRSPDYDAARCQRDGNCDGVRRATCSPHRTGYAVDLYLGQAPGFGPDSTADANRLHLSRTAAYRWLVANAGRFGFHNYPFEPWHWEWAAP